MEKKEQPKIIKGVIVEALPNTMFKVKVENEEPQLTYLSGKMKRFNIRVLVGDRVEIEVDNYGGKGKITKRL